MSDLRTKNGTSSGSTCPGCGRRFSPSGLSLARTSDPRCRQLLDGLPPLPLDPDDEDLVPLLPIPVQPFEGDFFGDYSPGDFDQFIDPEAASDSEHEELGPIIDLPPLHSPFTIEDDDDAIATAQVMDQTQAKSSYRSPPQSRQRRVIAEHTVQDHRQTYVKPFPLSSAAAPLRRTRVSEAPRWNQGYDTYEAQIKDGAPSLNPFAPFASKLDWDVAKWAKTRGSGSTAFTDLLTIEGVAQRLELSYKNSRELNRLIDEELPSGRPPFHRHEIEVGGEKFEVFFRDVLLCIKALFGDPEFAPLLLLTPEQHYTDESRQERVYFDMNTGKWWWVQQKRLEELNPGATVIPVIISSDKTQLTQFGNKTAYPVYLTIGNLPKSIRSKPSRRGQILLAYLPTTKLSHIKGTASRRRSLANLFHACLARVLAPLGAAGQDGIPVTSGDGITRRGHPILASYVGDYPEQVLICGCKTGECPKCPIPRNDVGEDCDTSRALRDISRVFAALDTLNQGPRTYTKACKDAGIKPIFHPFWERLPFCNIFMAITPDILHQLHQGVLKHVISWLQTAYGSDEIDARC
ncbi:uncharacterized protein BXZ73DRAFT_56964, partial [Epithele typhae]|uniref:uncharacterized protein n=1 Tax=Epithele typhae TaxID=378194 RepID=UPI002007C3AE